MAGWQHWRVPDQFSHFGICVSDVDRSLRFYCEGLGFEADPPLPVGDEYAALMEMDRVDLVSQFIRRGTTTIELLGFSVPAPVGDRSRRPVNKLGLTHLSFVVDDLEAAADRLAALGGTVVDGTRTSVEVGDTTLGLVFCTDPDGVRVELMQFGG